jgi:hypothetical protein
LVVDVEADPDLSVLDALPLADVESDGALLELELLLGGVAGAGVVVEDELLLASAPLGGVGLCATVVEELLLPGDVAGVVLVVDVLRSQPVTKAVPRARMAMAGRIRFMESPVVVDQNQPLETHNACQAGFRGGGPGKEGNRGISFRDGMKSFPVRDTAPDANRG